MTKWNKEMIDSLIKLVQNKDSSYGSIRDRMNDLFKLGLSRNACIGKARRLGLSGKRSVKESKSKPISEAPVEPEGPSREEALAALGLTESFGHLQGFTFIETRPIASGEPSGGRGAEDWRRLWPDGGCKFPLGDTQDHDFHFCGASKSLMDSYCQAHIELARGAAIKRVR